MLVFPHWRPELPSSGCRALQWAPPERFATYIARPVAFRPSPPQVSDEESSGGSSPAHGEAATVCGWRGCGVRLSDVSRLSAHVARVHAQPRDDGLFYCGWSTCARPQRGFNARYKMLVHVRTHTNERPHTCSQCNKSFSRAENLKIHLRSHSGEKPYVCPYEGCGKAYSNSSDRFKHTRTHTVDKPYCCKVPGCNKRYTDPSSLRKHVKTYKHFTPKESTRHDSSDEAQSPGSSPKPFTPLIDIESTHIDVESTSIPSYHSSSRPMISPPTTYSVPTVQIPAPVHRYPTAMDQSYLRPLPSPPYPLRIPSYGMSYLEYSQMYEHAYRNYYRSGMEFPILRPNVSDKVFSYSDTQYEEVQMNKISDDSQVRYSPMDVEPMPLNLKCFKSSDCKPVEELMRHSDLPLDLSRKN